ncbi:transcription factor Adf-1-like [Chrysoperla carnea]|uniref:transcription factor Adf-1-like n=1 Tax=Chrysoperla carnea TaxID=189513 RepID=UPI001D0932A5|nr:transcription factor Adf-1-like [Chrysoperla carnea]
MTSKVIFSSVDDEKLVETVAKFPCIYDTSNKLYKNQVAKDNAWKEVAEHTKKSANDCKKRWRNIKDTFFKRQKRRTGTGSSTNMKPKSWPLANMLSFLGKANHKRESISNTSADNNLSQADDEIGSQADEETMTHEDVEFITEDVTLEAKQPHSLKQTSTPSKDLFFHPSKRHKTSEKVMNFLEETRKERNELLRGLNQNRDDEIDLFFKSIAMSVKKLRPELINEAKMKSLQMVFDLENRNSMYTFARHSASTSNSAAESPSPIVTNYRYGPSLLKYHDSDSSHYDEEIM